MADKDDSPDSEAPASEKPKAEPEPEANVEAKVDAKAEQEEEEEEKADAKPVAATPDKPVSKSVEWLIAIAMMAILIGFLFLMMHMMRSARHSIM